MAQMNPSPSKPVVRYPTALLEDKELITIHDSRLPDYKALEYGTPYFDQNKFPGLKLIFQEPLGEDDRMVRRVWAGDRQDQDLYNADRKYSGGSTDHPILIRRYLFPEEGYTPLPTGTPDSQFPEAILVEEEVAQPENRNGYLAVTRVFETVPGPLLTGKLVTDKGQVATITTQVVAPGTTVTPSALTVSASVKPDSKGKSVLEKVEVSEVFGEKSFSKEVPDPAPQKFRVAIPATTAEETVAGTAAEPTLGTGELAKSEQQVTQFTKRTKRTARPKAALPKKLPQTATGQQQQKLYVEDTLQLGETQRRPSITVDVESEALGDGTYVVRTQDEVEIFTGDTFSAETNDPTPAKFRSKLPTRTEERTEAGIARKPELRSGEVAKSFEQVDKHKVRRRTVKRPSEVLPVTLTQVETNQAGQKVSVTETLQKGDTSEEPTATSTIQSEALGDGNYVVRRTQLPDVFDEKSRSVERPDNVPQKFRASLPTSTEEEVVEGQVGPIALGAGEVAASEQQITKFTKRKRRVSRQAASLPQTLTQVSTNDKGQLVTIRETLQQGGTTTQPSATTQVESEAIGDGTFIVRRSSVESVFPGSRVELQKDEDSLPPRFRAAIERRVSEETVPGTVNSDLALQGTQISASEEQVTQHTKRRRVVDRNVTPGAATLRGQNYDPTFDVILPYLERITRSGAELGLPGREVTPLSGTEDLVKVSDFDRIQKALSEINLSFPSRASLTLPPVLKNVKLIWDETKESGISSGSGRGSGFGQTWSWDVKSKSQANATAGLIPAWIVDIEEVWASGVPTTSHVFFLKYPVTESDILRILKAQRWPVFQPVSHTLVAFGKKIVAQENREGASGRSNNGQSSSSSTSSGYGTSKSVATSSVTLNIPPCLHGNISVKAEKETVAQASTFVTIPGVDGQTPSAALQIPGVISGSGSEAKVTAKIDFELGWTSPSDIPRSGLYLIDSRVEPYQYGYARVFAEVLDASIFQNRWSGRGWGNQSGVNAVVDVS